MRPTHSQLWLSERFLPKLGLFGFSLMARQCQSPTQPVQANQSLVACLFQPDLYPNQSILLEMAQYMTRYRIFPEHILACYLCYWFCLDESKQQVHDAVMDSFYGLIECPLNRAIASLHFIPFVTGFAL